MCTFPTVFVLIISKNNYETCESDPEWDGMYDLSTHPFCITADEDADPPLQALNLAHLET